MSEEAFDAATRERLAELRKHPVDCWGQRMPVGDPDEHPRRRERCGGKRSRNWRYYMNRYFRTEEPAGQ